MFYGDCVHVRVYVLLDLRVASDFVFHRWLIVVDTIGCSVKCTTQLTINLFFWHLHLGYIYYT